MPKKTISNGMKQAFIDFQKQFAFNPVIKNKKKYKKSDRFLILGMGGSGLPGEVLKFFDPSVKIITHKDYGLPQIPDKELKKYLIVANSYSGNTEETLDGLKLAHNKKLNVIGISTGGKLIKFCKKNKLPYIQVPNFGIQPRLALGFVCRAMLKAIGQNKHYNGFGQLAISLKGKSYESPGKKLAENLRGRVPIIYASTKNYIIAYNWKIKFNETGKIPAFYNLIPELNHTEMTGFDVKAKTKDLSRKFTFIFIRDNKDHKKIQKRMNVTAGLYKKRGLPVFNIQLKGKNIYFKIFSSLLLADWTAYYTSQGYGLESEQVPMVEEFKKMI